MSKYFRWNNNKKKRNNKNKRAKSEVSQCTAPSFRIDLQRAPAQRWIHIVNSYRKEIKRLIEAILSLEQFQLSSDDHQNNDQHHNTDAANTTFFANLTMGIFERLQALGGKQYIEEMRGIAKLFKKDGLSIEHVLLTHLLYESFCGCTSIVSKNTKHAPNSLVIGRTLDWIDFDEQLLRNLTIDVEVYRGNEYLYRYTTFAGYIGALTALKFNQFSFAINFRECSTNEASDDVHENDSWPIGLLGRYICDHCNDYESAAKMWNEAPLMAPTYVIICGHNQSVLITRDEAQSIQPLSVCLQEESKQQNDVNQEDAAKKTEYILQANIDHWSYKWNDLRKDKKQKKKKRKGKQKKQKKQKKKVDHDTMDSIRRLNTGHKCLQEKQCIDEDEMWEILYQYPIHDRNWTIYSTVMNVQSGYYKTTSLYNVAWNMFKNFKDRLIQRPNQWTDSGDIKQTDQEEKKEEKKPSATPARDDPFVISDDPVDEFHRTREQELYKDIDSLRDLISTAPSDKDLDKIKGFESAYRIPLRSYMWDILGLLRTNKRVTSENTETQLESLPCNGGIFQHFLRFGVDLNPFAKPNIHNAPCNQIRSLVDCAKHEYCDDLSPIILPHDVQFKIDGIWEMDVRIFRAITDNLDRVVSDKIVAQIHVAIWCNGAQKQTQFNYPLANIADEKMDSYHEEDIESDDDHEIQYYKAPDANQQIEDITNKCSDINIEALMRCNKAKNVIKKIWNPPKNDKETEQKASVFDEEVMNPYDKLEEFICEAIMENEARPKSGDAVMILFDTTNAPQLTAYIWREILTENEYKQLQENDINIGEKRIQCKESRKRRYFELNAPLNDTCIDTDINKVNVGQYVGMDIFLQSSSAVHQFWTIFNTETRFATSHPSELWRDYYIHETIFEAVENLDDEYEEYMDNDTKRRALYERIYGKAFVDQLNDRKVIFEEKTLSTQNDKSRTNDKMPDLNDYKPFAFHCRRAQYAKYFGTEFIRKLNDKSTKFEQEELREKLVMCQSNKKLPDLRTYAPFKFHWRRAKNADDFKRDLLRTRPIKNLSPKNFKQLYSDAMKENDDKDAMKENDDKDEYKEPM